MPRVRQGVPGRLPRTLQHGSTKNVGKTIERNGNVNNPLFRIPPKAQLTKAALKPMKSAPSSPQTPCALRRPFPLTKPFNRDLMAPSRYEAIAKALATGRWPLYFFGMAGRGKTIAAAMVFAEWPGTSDGATAPRFWPSSKILTDLVEARFSGGVSAIRNTVNAASLLVMDDIADRNMTDARRAALLDILNWREDKPLILTSNFAPDELNAVVNDDRLVSRILAGQTLQFGGPDLRLKDTTITAI